MPEHRVGWLQGGAGGAATAETPRAARPKPRPAPERRPAPRPAPVFSLEVPEPPPDPLAAVRAAAEAALAGLDGLAVEVPAYATSARRRRLNRVGHTIEAARRELRRLAELSAEAG